MTIDTIDMDGGSIVVETERVHTVDAYGTIKLPAGEFQCLRLRSEGNEDVLLLAHVQGPPNQTNLNFTNASYVQAFSSVDTDVGHDDVQTTSPRALSLAQNYPNPFNPDTRIALDVPSFQRIELAVFNVKGERIRILYSGNLYPGSHSFMWDSKDSHGSPVSSGIYVVQLRGRVTSLSRRMILMR